MYQHILVAVDGSPHSSRAADHALKIVSFHPESLLEIVYVIDADHVKSDVLHHWNSHDEISIRKHRVVDVEEKVKQAGVRYQTTILNGVPGPTIVKYANENEVDLIVLGSRGLNVLQEFVLGSVSHKVAKRANCPVMIVK